MSIQARAQVMRARQADPGESAAGDGEVAGRLAEAVDAGEAGDVVIECIGAAASRVEEYPEEPTIVPGSPADVVKHDGAGKSLGFQESFHQLHRNQVALVGLGAGDDNPAVALRTSVRVQQSFREVAGGKQFQEAELVLPAQAIGLEFVQQIEDSQVAPQLLAGGRGREVLGIGFSPSER